MRRLIALAAIPSAVLALGLLAPAAAFADGSRSAGTEFEFESDLSGSSATGPVIDSVAQGLSTG